MRAWDLATSIPWAATEESLRTLLEVAARENLTPEAVAARLGRPLVNTYAVEFRDGVAIVPVTGMLFRYANLFTELSGATSYELLARDIRAALDNPNVRAVLLSIDSPGGETNGVSELARMVYEARAEKPVVAYVSGLGASGAYWLAAAGSEVVISDTAVLGSIGVVLSTKVYPDADPKTGVKTVRIVSSQSPRKQAGVETQDGLAEARNLVDSLAQVFIDTVAEFRGTTAARVAAEFGQGGVFVGQAAVAAGLADRVGSFEGVLAELASGQYGRTVSGDLPRAAIPHKEVTVAATTTAAEGGATAPATPTQDPAPKPTAGAEPALTSALVAEKYPTIAAELVEQGAKAEADRRDKLSALAKGVAGAEELLAAAFADRSITPGAFAEALIAKSKAAGTAKLEVLKAADAKLGKVEAGTETPSGDETVESVAKAVLDTGKKFNHPSTATGQR